MGECHRLSVCSLNLFSLLLSYDRGLCHVIFMEFGGETRNSELPSLPLYHQFLAFSSMLSLYFMTT